MKMVNMFTYLYIRDRKRMLPTFSTYVIRVFDGCQKLFWLFSKALVTVVKNYQNFTSLCVNLFCYACGILFIFYGKSPIMVEKHYYL